ncbi:MAG: N-6 DNA methylase [Methanobrevibacter sp.]|uniref:HsdM family class I SAM-dependent methyltransferase n=1 Tax=Methanobrevibacter sp. TaxID=66852 RepID=UPI0025E6AF3A|nr:N-6 DNA methylase [Methanobrevibacter sp.]MBR6992606.1 N-6 DNA methylase [Methanobrevibacter sp.]
MSTEKNTDLFIAKLLNSAKIDYLAEGSKIKEIQEALKTASKKGTGEVGFPEFVGKSNDFIIVIEDKAETSKQAKYCEKNPKRLDLRSDAIISYAENGALHYAKHIAENTNFKKIFAFGCSGDEKHHIIKPIFVDENNYQLLNEVENFENFNENNIDKYYKEIVLNETPAEVIEIEEVLEKSKELNELLTSRGSLTDAEKPLVVSAILLALNENAEIDQTLNADEISNDGKKISDAVCCNLQRIKVEQKVEAIMHQFNFIKDRPNLNEIDENLGKTPLKYFTEYIKDKIFPAISTTHEDILGFFYGEFIKYSGGDGQSLGIVLTPTHITELFCDLLEVTPQDKVLDPCAGTGSFLVSSMNKMISLVKTEEEKKYIKQNNLHGIELKENMFSIATTNMILRGDGKTNLVCADFLKQDPQKLRKNKYSVGMMNPPYSLRKNKETAHLSEIHFVKHLLDSLDDNARCGVIVPQSAMVGKNKEDNEIKKEILKNHTLEGVISLNGDTTFYRVGTVPCIAIFTANKPHPKEKRCKFINFEDDGYTLRKHTGIVKTERAIERKEYLLKCWNDEIDAPTKFMVKSKVEVDDEWLHAFYYFNDEIPKDNDFQTTLCDYMSFEFNMVIQGNEYLFKE